MHKVRKSIADLSSSEPMIIIYRNTKSGRSVLENLHSVVEVKAFQSDSLDIAVRRLVSCE